jgi:hypothetical protein
MSFPILGACVFCSVAGANPPKIDGPPRGPSISGGLEPTTGSQQKSFIHKMGNAGCT